MARYFDDSIDLEEALVKAVSKNAGEEIRQDFDGLDDEQSIKDNIMDVIGQIFMYSDPDNKGGEVFGSKFAKDLAKVQFDCENTPTGGRGKWEGFKTFSNGMTGFCMWAGGDWESPIHWVIYHDGSAIRAYIPSSGQIWNKKTKEAIGNDDEEDAVYLTSIGMPVKPDYLDVGAVYDKFMNVDLMSEDVSNRIKKR